MPHADFTDGPIVIGRLENAPQWLPEVRWTWRMILLHWLYRGLDFLAGRYARVRIRPWRSKMIGKAVEFTSTVTSGRVPREVYEARLAACGSCEHVHRDGDRLYCRACGCPEWSLAELHKKLWFARLRCPKGKFAA